MALQGMIHEIPRVDDTLTKKGQFADAKKVGDTLAVIQERLNNIDPHFARNVNYENASGLKATNVQGAIDEVVSILYHPNLLVNGDFCCNQRGLPTYAGHNVYSLDMWQLVNGLNITKNEGSVTLTSPADITYTGRLKQALSLPMGVYTLSVKVVNCSHAVPITNFGEIPAGFSGVYRYTSIEHAPSAVELFVLIGASIEIEWIQLERGSFATPHVAEPYDMALARCMKYLKVLDVMYAAIEFTYSDNRFITVANFDKMAAKPTATIGKAMYYDTSWAYTEATISTKYCENGAIEVRTAANDKAPFATTTTLKLFDVILSCEPT